SRFAPHLEKCLGMGRNSSRIANRRIASSNNTSKSESDQEDNDDINDNDWSYGSEKKGELIQSNPNSPRRSKSLKHKNGGSGINYETLGPEELRSILTTQCGVVSEHTKKMYVELHTDEQSRAVRVFLSLGRPSMLPDSETMLENDGYDAPDGQLIMSRLQWDGSSDISPSDSASSKASTNNSESKIPKKKNKPSTLTLTTTGGGGERDKGQERERVVGGGGSSSAQNALGLSSRKKRPKLPIPPAPSIYDDLN
uniref:SAGA-associated factor 11 n=1 Tax=Sinocyclocheilus rhinocerous TaxID=307959 RepID=A0A673H308_9TELE